MAEGCMFVVARVDGYRCALGDTRIVICMFVLTPVKLNQPLVYTYRFDPSVPVEEGDELRVLGACTCVHVYIYVYTDSHNLHT